MTPTVAELLAVRQVSDFFSSPVGIVGCRSLTFEYS